MARKKSLKKNKTRSKKYKAPCKRTKYLCSKSGGGEEEEAFSQDAIGMPGRDEQRKAEEKKQEKMKRSDHVPDEIAEQIREVKKNMGIKTVNAIEKKMKRFDHVPDEIAKQIRAVQKNLGYGGKRKKSKKSKKSKKCKGGKRKKTKRRSSKRGG